IPDRVLRWAYVVYLLLLGVLSLMRLRDKHDVAKADRAVMPGTTVLLGVGIVSGLSSGLLGIGGGLAITAILAAGMKVPQHVAQALALAVTTLPLTLPAAWVYAEQTSLPWWVIAGIIVGLWFGTAAGARLATLLSERMLRRLLPPSIFVMAAFMAWRAL
ncbi:MAG: TSUP family transporter, partial [Rhodospirillaceae bacterium]